MIYLLEDNLCRIWYVGKGERPFNIPLKDYRKDVKDASAFEADEFYTLPGHNFNTIVKFVLIEQLINKWKTKGQRKILNNQTKVCNS